MNEQKCCGNKIIIIAVVIWFYFCNNRAVKIDTKRLIACFFPAIKYLYVRGCVIMLNGLLVDKNQRVVIVDFFYPVTECQTMIGWCVCATTETILYK